MTHYRFGWIENAVETDWWVEDLEDDRAAARRAEETEEAEYRAAAGYPDGPQPTGGVLYEVAGEETLATWRELRSEARRGEEIALVPPPELRLQPLAARRDGPPQEENP